MFEELGFTYDENEQRIAIYTKTPMGTELYKCVFAKSDKERFRLKLYECFCSMDLLKAINKQVEELGWDCWGNEV